MKLKIEIEMDNAAFECASRDYNARAGNEAARILTELAADMTDCDIAHGEAWQLRDVNGNHVGEAKVTK